MKLLQLSFDSCLKVLFPSYCEESEGLYNVRYNTMVMSMRPLLHAYAQHFAHQRNVLVN